MVKEPTSEPPGRSHPDDQDAVTADAAPSTNRECTDCTQRAYDEYQLLGCREGNSRQNRVCKSRLAEG